MSILDISHLHSGVARNYASNTCKCGYSNQLGIMICNSYPNFSIDVIVISIQGKFGRIDQGEQVVCLTKYDWLIYLFASILLALQNIKDNQNGWRQSRTALHH